jgi:hypothetical protein
MEQTRENDPADNRRGAVALRAEYAIEIARGAGLTADQLQVLGDILRRHAGSRELIALRRTISALLARYAEADAATAQQTREGTGWRKGV